MVFSIEVSGRVIQIECKYKKTFYMCLKYLSYNKSPDIVLKISNQDIIREREYFKIPEELKISEYGYGDNYFEYIAVFRKIAERLIDDQIMLMHGAVVAVDGKGYMFTAASGIGKTTHTKLWLKNIPGAYVVNGDKPLLEFVDNEVWAYGTPWSGKEGLNTKGKVNLQAICLLERSPVNEITEISYLEAFGKLYQQIFKPDSAERMTKTLEMLDMLGSRVKLYTLKCNMEDDAATRAYNYMNRRNKTELY